MQLPTLWRKRERRVLPAPGAFTFPAYGGGGINDIRGLPGVVGAILPGSSVDWATEAGEVQLNYAVHACLRWIGENLPEPERQVVRREGEEWVPDEEHPCLDLLENPNQEYDDDSLFAAVSSDYALTGNSYLKKEYDNLGRVVELWWAPWWMVYPRWPTDGKKFIESYVYRPGGSGTPEPWKPEDVIHFRWGLDARTGGRLGVHRTLPVLHAIASLNEGMVYTASVLRNMGIVPNLLTSKKLISEDNRNRLKAWFQQAFSRDGRGKVGLLDDAEDVDLKQLGLSPESLALDKILQRPELAVCAAFGIHPGVVYMGQPGGGRTAFDNGGQLAEARRASYHDCLVPMTKRFGKTLTRRLLIPDYGVKSERKEKIAWDFSNVEALQEDQNALATRLVALYQGGLMTRNEGRSKLNLKPVEDLEPAPGGALPPGQGAPQLPPGQDAPPPGDDDGDGDGS